MAAPPPISDPEDKFAYQIAAKNYGGILRKLPILTIPKGALLFHYFNIPPREPGQSDILYQAKLLQSLLQNYGVNIKMVIRDERIVWIICFSKETAHNDFFYSVPAAGFGVAGPGRTYNTGLCSTTTRDTRWAFLKSGSAIPNDEVGHHTYPYTITAFDRDRVLTCNQLPGTNCRGGVGKAYDVCLTPAFQNEQQVDGYIAIAESDELMKIRPMGGYYQFDSFGRAMFEAMRSWFEKIQQHGNLEEDHFLWTMNLLSLQTDYRQNTVSVGFPEFVSSPAGWKNTDPSYIPAHVLGAGWTENVDYAVTQALYNPPGNCILREFAIYQEDLDRFFTQFIHPFIFIKCEQLITPHGKLNPFGQEHFAHYIPQVPMTDELRYQMNHQMALYLQSKALPPPGQSVALKYDPRLNVFFRFQAGLDNLDKQIAVQFTTKPGNELQTPKRIGVYARFLLPDIENRTILEYLKIAHETISNVKWSTNWMKEYTKTLNLNSPKTIRVPVGPLYNAYTVPLTDYGNILANYRQIISLLENVPMAVQHSQSYRILHDDGIVADLNAWANRANVVPGAVDAYWTGTWFTNRPANFHGLRPGPVHQGGSRTNRKYNQRQLKQTQHNRKANRNRTQKNIKMNRRQWNNASFLNDSTFAKNLRTNLKSPTRNNGMNTSQTNSSPTNMPRITNAKTNTSTVPTGHASPNIIPMSKDTFDSLQKMMRNPLYSNIMKSIFVNDTTIED